MSDVLFDTFKEYSRIEEELSLTEEGLFVKGDVPESYGGVVLDMKVVHSINLINTVGNMITLEFHNPIPKGKDRALAGPITIDGAAPVTPANGFGVVGKAGGLIRTWVTVLSTQLHGKAKDVAQFTTAQRAAGP